MAILTASKISTVGITDAQIGACHKVLHQDGNYYLVENSRGEVDANGDVIEYKVSYSRERGFQCQCKAAEFGTLCWHIKASLACEREVNEAIAGLEAAICAPQAPVKPVSTAPVLDAETLARVQTASSRPAKVSKARTYQPKAFSILR